MARFTITAGPCKLDLMLALFDSTCMRPRPVTFTLQAWPERSEPTGPSNPVTVQVHSVEREDGSGESWNVEACDSAGTAYHIYYSTRRRSGVTNTK